MTNRIKTVQNPRLILLACKNAERIGGMISDILNYCRYNTCINDFSENTDFVIENKGYNDPHPDGIIADTVLFDDSSNISTERISEFREKVTSYEYATELFGEDMNGVITYSADNYGADVACRNITENDGRLSFDIVGNGILSRINITEGKYTVDEVLACMGVLLAAGMPMASISGFFDNEEGR